MREIKQVTYNQTAFYITQMHPMKSLIVFKRVIALAGPTIATAIESSINSGESLLDSTVDDFLKDLNLKEIFSELISSLDEKELEDTASLLLACVTVGKGSETALTLDNKEVSELNLMQFFNLLKDIFLHNFLDFLPVAAVSEKIQEKAAINPGI